MFFPKFQDYICRDVLIEIYCLFISTVADVPKLTKVFSGIFLRFVPYYIYILLCNSIKATIVSLK